MIEEEMDRCIKYEQLFEKAISEELNDSETEIFYNHLASCAECSEKFEGLKSTLKFFRSLNRPEPNPDFLDNFWEKLEPKLIRNHTPLNPIPGKMRSGFADWFSNLKYSLTSRLTLKHQLAGGFVLLLIGVLIGRYIITEDNTITPGLTINTESNMRVVDKYYRDAEEYMQRSKILMLSMMNYDATADEMETISLMEQQKISKELLKKAAVLKDQLNDAQLKNLVSDIEVILLQISNLEVKYDLSGIELIQEGVDSKGLILKINIQEMNIDNEESNAQNNTQNNGSSI